MKAYRLGRDRGEFDHDWLSGLTTAQPYRPFSMLPILQNQSVLTMSSREIADLTGKDHGHVKRDIAAMIMQLNYPDRQLKDCPKFDRPELDSHPITVSKYEHAGNQYEELILNQEYCYLLVSGYSVTLRQKIIQRWHELETKNQFQIPQNFAEALRLAADQQETIQAQAAQIEAQKPAVLFVERYVHSTGNMGFRQVAKLLKIKENEFRAFLHNKRIMYRLGSVWMPYANHIDAGRFYVTAGISHTDHTFNNAKFTPKGVEWISDLLNSQAVE